MGQTMRISSGLEYPAGKKWVLALQPDCGSVFRCGSREQIHIQLGDAHVETDALGFQSIVNMMLRAAANFEVMLQMDGSNR